eukprot:8558942-Alexandrium_andersonii.AAC.1
MGRVSGDGGRVRAAWPSVDVVHRDGRAACANHCVRRPAELASRLKGGCEGSALREQGARGRGDCDASDCLRGSLWVCA